VSVFIVDIYHFRLLHYKCVKVLLFFICSVHPFMTLHLIKSPGNINPCFPTGLWSTNKWRKRASHSAESCGIWKHVGSCYAASTSESVC